VSAFEPQFQVEVVDRFTPGLSGRADRDYLSPPQSHAGALALVTLLLDTAALPPGEGPWHRPMAGGRRTVRLRAAV
jgi:hypothetical protein